MKDEKFLKAYEIKREIKELDEILLRLGDKEESAWLKANNYSGDIRLSGDTRTAMMEGCARERERLYKEFEEL